MMSDLRSRCLRLRALWVALLLLAAVWQPALMAASQVHESGHLLTAGHAHDTHEETGVPADEPGSPAGDAWHLLMHLGHCCSHPTAALFDAPTFAAAVAVSPPPPGRSRTALDAALPQPLRPPIVA